MLTKEVTDKKMGIEIKERNMDMKRILQAGTQKEPDSLELENRKLARGAAAEGFVLLENDGILPFTATRVALYGAGARKTASGGTGSGAVRERYSVSIAQGLKNAGITITTEGWLDRFDAYFDQCYEAYRARMEESVKGLSSFYQIIHEVSTHPFVYPTSILISDEEICKDVQSGTSTAIYVLARQAGEGCDRENKKGDYQPDETEIQNLVALSKGYPDLIVIINAGGAIDLSFLDTVPVNALIFYGQGGEEGGNALADVLTGKVSFSGKLTASWARSWQDIPSSDVYSAASRDPHVQEYTEDIFVGYRYYDSFDIQPRYRFGFGLSYTKFTKDLVKLHQKENLLEVKVHVKNIGEYAGKEVVQLYARMPAGRLGGEKRRLIAFAKTRNLIPGEEESLLLTVPLSLLTRYDEKQSAYILEKGLYLLQDEVQKTGAAVYVQNEFKTEQCTRICSPAHEIYGIRPPEKEQADEKQIFDGFNGIKLVLDLSGMQTLRHRYQCSYDLPDNTEPWISGLIEKMSAEELATLVTGAGTEASDSQVLALGASGTTTGRLYEKYGIPNIVLSDGPSGLNLSPQVVRLKTGDYRAARVPEVLEAYKRYRFGSAGKLLDAKLADPASGTVHYQYATAWPCSQLLAQSWNTDILYRIGDGTGKEMEKYGISIWLAPGMNIQRNPLCGRTFEYYSEDPLVSGRMAAALVLGVQKHPGRGVSVKHFVANNCELNRNTSSSNLSERALREIYLKGFEIAIKEAHPVTVMGSYNLVNGTYVNNSADLLTNVLRCEWGFDGLVMSDWNAMKCVPGNPVKALTGDVLQANRAQCDLIMPGRKDQTDALVRGVTEGLVDIRDIKRSAARILHLVAQNKVIPFYFSVTE